VAAEAKLKSEVDARAVAVDQVLKEQNEKAREIGAALGGFLAKTNLTSDARNGATRMQKQMDTATQTRLGLSARIAEAKDKPAAEAARLISGVSTEAERLAKELARATDQQKALIGSPKSYYGGAPAAVANTPAPSSSAGNHIAAKPEPPRRLEDIVPVCEFTFESADGKPMQVAIDGGTAHSVPTRARLASGRHVLLVRRDRAVEERRELLLCGHVASVPIEPLK
jgi:hypothetical protein